MNKQIAMKELRRIVELASDIVWLARMLYKHYARCDEKRLARTIEKILKAIEVYRERIKNKAFIRAVAYLITEIEFNIAEGDLERVVSLMKKLEKTAMAVYNQKSKELAMVKKLLQ